VGLDLAKLVDASEVTSYSILNYKSSWSISSLTKIIEKIIKLYYKNISNEEHMIL
jgi:hypothetical protein